jgi:hypothetical protein
MPTLLHAKESKMKAAKNAQNTSTQRHLRISEITNDTLILKNGGVRAVLEVDAVNFNLKSEAEQTAIISSYQSFLNTLEHPVQIVIQSRKLELDTYLAKLKVKAANQNNELLKQQTLEYVDYIKRLLEYADIMDKNFYVVVPYEALIKKKSSLLGKFLDRMRGKESYSDYVYKKKNFNRLKKGLDSRVNTVQAGLENCGLKVKRLGTTELIKLYYTSYNPEVSPSDDINDNIK